MITQQPFRQIPEGSWWVAWMDHVTYLETGSLIEVVLVPLPPALVWSLSREGTDGNQTTLSELLEESSRQVIVQVNVAAIPLFTLGDVFSGRRLVMSKDDPSAVASICDLPRVGRTVRIEIDTVAFSLTPSGERRIRASGIRLDRRRVSPSLTFLCSRYPVTHGSSRVLPLRCGSGSALTPAVELLRSLVAPQPKLVSRLFSGALDAVIPTIVRSYEAATKAAPSFVMALAEGYERSDLPFVANLIEAYSPAGSASVQRIAPSFIGPHVPPVAPRGGVPVPICFPFGSGRLTIVARCVDLPNGDFLLCKMIGGRWPRGEPLAVTIERTEVDSARDPTSRKGGTPSEGGDDPEDRGHELVEPPGAGGDASDIEVEQIRWDIPTKIEVMYKLVPRSPSKTVSGEGSPSGSTSIMEPVPGGSHRQGSARHAGPEMPERFRQTLDMLDRIVAAGDASAHEDVVPPIGFPRSKMESVKYGEVIAWSFGEGHPRLWTRP